MSYQRRWKRRWWAAATAAAAAGAVLLAGCGGGGSTSASATISPASGHGLAGFPGTKSPTLLPTAMPSSMPGMPSSAPASQAAAPVAANSVTIHNFAFGPQVVMVKPGTTVHWMNRDTEAHTVTSDSGLFSSVAIMPGHGYSHTFMKPGTYPYHCMIHPFMTGKVVVT